MNLKTKLLIIIINLSIHCLLVITDIENIFELCKCILYSHDAFYN